MEKKSIFGNIILFLCFIVLAVTAVEINQVRLQTKSPYAKTLIQKIKENFPQEVNANEKITNENNAEFIIKNKNIVQKITAPTAVTKYDYWGDSHTEINEYTTKNPDNRIVYASVNVKSLFKKQANINELIDAKMIYADKYEFDCSTIKVTKDKTDFTSDIKLMPLQSEDVYFLSEIPKDFVNSSNPIVLQFLIGDTKYQARLK